MSSATNTMSADWLDKKFLERALGNEVKTFSVDNKGNTNDFYTSSLHSVIVNLKSGKTEHFVIKKLIDREGNGKLFAESSMFEREIHMYKNVLPKLHELLQKAFPGCEPLAPRYVFSETGVLIMEDLFAAGFHMADRTDGLTLHHSLVVMRTLAKFHSASVILYEREPELFKPFMESVYSELPIQKLQSNFFEGMTSLLADEVKTWPEFGERYARKFRELSGQMMTLVVDGARRQEGRFNVLTHDDLWTNNMLFRYPERVKILDYQMPHYASPGNDIQMYLTMSVTDDVRRNHFDILIKEYHKTLCSTLTALGYKQKLITLEELYEEIKKSALYGFVINVVFLPGVLSTPGVNVPMFEPDGPPPTRDIYEGSRVRGTLAEILKDYEKQGTFSLD